MIGAERRRDTIFRFNKGDIKRSNYTIRGRVPTSVHFGMGFIANELTKERTWTNFREIFVKYVCGTADLVKMGEVGLMSEP